MDIINALLHSWEFWAALWALLNAILLYFVPAFPVEILAALNALAAVVFAIVTGRATPAKVDDIRTLRALNKPK